jgi:hypothetical protein
MGRLLLGIALALAALGAEAWGAWLTATRVPLGVGGAFAVLGLHMGAAALGAEALRLRARGAPEGHAAGLRNIVPGRALSGARRPARSTRRLRRGPFSRQTDKETVSCDSCDTSS